MYKRILSSFMLVIVTIIFAGCSVEKYNNEWVEKNGNKYYYDETGKKITNCYYEVGNERYCFDSQGVMQKNCWVNEEGKKVYHNNEGKAIKNGWEKINGEYYYFVNYDSQKGWVTYDGENYYLDSNGVMQKDKWVDNNKYYVDLNGVMLKNTTKVIDGKNYVFDNFGNGIKKTIDIVGIPIQEYLTSWISYEINREVRVYANITKAYEKEGNIIIEGDISADGPKKYTGVVSPVICYELKDSEGYIIYDGDEMTDYYMVGDKFKKSLHIPRIDEGETYYFSITNIFNNKW